MRGIWRCYYTLATDGATPAVPLAYVSSHSLSLLSDAMSRHYSAFLRKCRAWVCPQVTLCRIRSHCLDSVAEVAAIAAGASVSDVVGTIGTEAGLSLQNGAMKMWPTSLSLYKPLSPIPSPSIDRLDKTEVPTPQACIYLLGIQYLVSLCDGLAGYARFPLTAFS